MPDITICEERHKGLDKVLETHDRRLNAHSTQLDELAKSDAVNTKIIEQLCKKLDGLTTAMWALVLTAAGGLVGFFFYAIQSKVF
jgi:hypothetical protein